MPYREDLYKTWKDNVSPYKSGLSSIRKKHLPFRKVRVRIFVSDQVAETCDACDRTEDLRALRFSIYTNFCSGWKMTEKALKPIKPFLNYEEQIKNLVERKGMVITDCKFAASKLENISYFALIDGYKDLLIIFFRL